MRLLDAINIVSRSATKTFAKPRANAKFLIFGEKFIFQDGVQFQVPMLIFDEDAFANRSFKRHADFFHDTCRADIFAKALCLDSD